MLSSNAKPLHNDIRWIVAVAAFHRPDHQGRAAIRFPLTSIS